MKVHAFYNSSGNIGVYLKIDGFITTNTYKYMSTTSPHLYSKSQTNSFYYEKKEEGENDANEIKGERKDQNEIEFNNKDMSNSVYKYKYFSEWSIKLPEKLLPSFKSKNFSVFYEIELVLVEIRNKVTYRNKIEIHGNNLNCEADVNITEINNDLYYNLKKEICTNILNSGFYKNFLKIDLKINSLDKDKEDNCHYDNFLLSNEQNEEVFSIKNGALIKNDLDKIVTDKNVKSDSSGIENEFTKITSLNKHKNDKFTLLENISKNQILKIKEHFAFQFDCPNIENLSKEHQKLKIKKDDEVYAYVEISDVLEQNGSFIIKYNKNIVSTIFNVIKQDYVENELIDAEMLQCVKFNSKNCIMKTFYLEIDKNLFSIKCDKFERKFILIIVLNEIEVSMEIKIISSNVYKIN